MKLLDKKGIVQQKNLERKREIDEGIKLATKVDTLREAAAKEETNLLKFRDENITRVKKEIDKLIDKKSSIENEIEVLSKQREELKKPLDSEWEQVRIAEKKLENIITVIEERESTLASNEKNYKDRSSKLEKEKLKIEALQMKANKIFEEAEKCEVEAKNTLRTAREKESQVNKKLETREKILDNRELDIAARERDIINLSEKVAKDRRELDLREIAINDKYKQLLRTQDRIKKHG